MKDGQEPTERERWRRRRVLLSSVPLVGWILLAGTMVLRGSGGSGGGLGLGCVTNLGIAAQLQGGAAVTMAVWVSRNDPK